MLTSHELATLRAALLFWEEEIAVHGPKAARSYLDMDEIEPLSAAKVATLRRRLTTHVRYLDLLPATGNAPNLLTADEAAVLPRTDRLATVILP